MEGRKSVSPAQYMYLSLSLRAGGCVASARRGLPFGRKYCSVPASIPLKYADAPSGDAHVDAPCLLLQLVSITQYHSVSLPW